MRYCPNCSLLNEGGELCADCGGPVRQPLENDPVLLIKTDPLHASMLEPLLKEAQIPYSKQGRMGAAFVMWSTPLLEEYSFFVPFGAYEQASELAAVACGGAENAGAEELARDEAYEEIPESEEEDDE